MATLFKHYVFFPLLLFGLTACATDFGRKEIEIYDSWTLEQIVYDDKSINTLGPGNFVQIYEDRIVEIIKGHGKRQYSYTKQKNILSLISGNDSIMWEIVAHDAKKLQIETPLGLYILKR